MGEVFSAALDLPKDERDSFLRTRCAGDQRLLIEVHELLEAGDAAEGFLEAFDADLASRLLRESGAVTDEDRRIGPFRVKEEIGRGGMGVVYLAERADGQFEQRVALKLIKRGMDSEAVLRRFALERQILARLQHPNIARLHDGGMTAEGQPYFAMEYVEGTPLTDYCDARRLEISKRLELYRQVCSAVGYAHQNLVVHRDLKPSNMLVTESGVVKLLDFGIAKLLEGDGDMASTLTRTGDRPMTPQYASPEQIAGGDVTTATDVYALGAVLYEVLSGRRAHGRDRDPRSRLERLVPPSSALLRTTAGESESVSAIEIARRRNTTVKKLQRRLAGDLDRIVGKALSDDPTRRYRSAEALLNDVERFLEGLPVEATGESATYRLKKFVRRHLIGVATSIAVLTSLAVGLGTAVWQAGEKAAQAARAEQISAFLTDLFVDSDPDNSRRSDLTAHELLSAGVARLDTGLVGQPDLQAEILFTVGKVFMKMGRYVESEDAHRKALAIRESIDGRQSEVYATMATELVTALRGQSRYAEASEVLREVIEIKRELGDDDDVDFALVLLDQASIESEKEADYEEAEKLVREGLRILDDKLGPEHEQLARGYSTLGWILYDHGKYAESVEAYRTSLTMWTSLVGERHRSTTKAMSSMANGLGRIGRTDEAEQLLRRALAIRRDLLGSEHPDVATNLNNLGFLLSESKAYQGAVEVYREACSIYQNRLGDDHIFHGICISNLGAALGGAGRYREADSLLMRALELHEARYGPDHPDVALVQYKIADLNVLAGKIPEAIVVYERALSIMEKHLGTRHPTYALTQTGLADALEKADDLRRAEELYTLALDVQVGALGEDHPRVAATRSSLERVRRNAAGL